MVAIVFEGEIAIDDEEDFLLSACELAEEIAELLGSLSIMGKKDNFLIGAHIWS